MKETIENESTSNKTDITPFTDEDYKYVGKAYRHFKGGYYWITSVAPDANTLETRFTYQSLQDRKEWNRTKTNFFEPMFEYVYNDNSVTRQTIRFEEVTDTTNLNIPTITTKQTIQYGKIVETANNYESMIKDLMHTIIKSTDNKRNTHWKVCAENDKRLSIKVLVAEYDKYEKEYEEFLKTKAEVEK